MKKIIIIVMIHTLIIPLSMYIKPPVAYASSGIEQPFSKNKNVQGVFFAVAEKGGMKWSGANSFHDALKQTDYLNHINKVIDIPDGKSTKVAVKEGWDMYSKEFLKKPVALKGKPGVGVIELSLGAFLFSYGVTRTVIGIFENAIQNNENVKTLEDIAQNGVSYESIGNLVYVRNEQRAGNDPAIRILKVYHPNTTIGYDIQYGYGFESGTPYSYGIQMKPYERTDPKTGKVTHQYVFDTWAKTIFKGDGREHVNQKYNVTFIDKEIVDALEGGHVATITPTDMGTLTTPDWTSTPPAKMPKTVEIEVPIDDEGNIDPERQLQPDNPATNDPTKPLKPTKPDYESNPDEKEDEDTKPAPSPNLTPKPDPGSSPLPQPSPQPQPDPNAPPKEPIYGDGEESPKTTPEDTKNRWGALVTNKFPFSLPWDIGRMLEPLLADPKRPFVKVDTSFLGMPIKFSHNFLWMDDYITFVRTFILIGFNLFMINATRRLMGGGQ